MSILYVIGSGLYKDDGLLSALRDKHLTLPTTAEIMKYFFELRDRDLNARHDSEGDLCFKELIKFVNAKMGAVLDSGFTDIEGIYKRTSDEDVYRTRDDIIINHRNTLDRIIFYILTRGSNNLYRGAESPDGLYSNPLLKFFIHLRKSHSKIITTNYDLTLERLYRISVEAEAYKNNQALPNLPSMNQIWGGLNRKSIIEIFGKGFVVDHQRQMTYNPEIASIYKIHGSINLFFSNTWSDRLYIVSRPENDSGDLSIAIANSSLCDELNFWLNQGNWVKPLFVRPGSVIGQLNEIDHLDSIVRAAKDECVGIDKIVVIGHSLQDQKLNEIIANICIRERVTDFGIIDPNSAVVESRLRSIVPQEMITKLCKWDGISSYIQQLSR